MTKTTTECFLSSWTLPNARGEEQTLPQLFARTSQENRERVVLRRRSPSDETPVTYGELSREASVVAEAILDLGVEPGARVGLLADNCVEWLVADLATLTAGCIDVPRGTDTTLDETLFILKHSGSRVAFVQGRKRFEEVRDQRESLPELRWLVLIGGRVEGPGQEGLTDWDSLVERGRVLRDRGSRRVEESAAAIDPDDVATIVYTSGTTGDPKGVMLSHRNILHNVRAIRKRVPVTRDDVLLSILPCWHMFERVLEYIVLDRGAQLVYTDRRRFRKDLSEQAPTILGAVPRIWEALHCSIDAQLEKAPAFRRLLARRFLGSAQRQARLRCGEAARALGNRPPVGWKERLQSLFDRPMARLGDRLVFRKVRAALGGKMRLGISGGGSLPEGIDVFFQAIGMPLFNGYGLTETAPIVSVRTFDQNLIGSIGRPLVDTYLRVVDPEGRELEQGRIGILLVRGPQVMKGYFRNERATRRVLDDKGWLSTGDLVRIAPTGELVIVGRSKDTIVLSGGENVEPAVVESEIGTSPLVAQILVVGQDRKQLGALVVPDQEGFLTRGIDLTRLSSTERILPDGPVGRAIREELERLTKRLRPFERVAKIQLMDRPFTIETGEVTPTFKLKRQVILERHAERIDQLFR